MPRRRSLSSPQPPAVGIVEGAQKRRDSVCDRYGLLARNAYQGVVSMGFRSGSSAIIWMSEAGMVEASIGISQPVSICVPSQSSQEAKMLEMLCSGKCLPDSKNRPGLIFAVGVAWPSKTLERNGIRLSKQLAQSLGCPTVGSALLISPLSVKSSPPDIRKLLRIQCRSSGDCTTLLQECKQLTLQICEGSFSAIQNTPGIDTDTPFSSPSKLSPVFASPLKNSGLSPATPGRGSMNVPELTSAAAMNYLKSGSSKLKQVVEKLAGGSLYGRLLLAGNVITVPVCGNECFFHVKSAESMKEDTQDMLSAKLEDLSLDTSNTTQDLFYISHRTSVSIDFEEKTSNEAMQQEKLADVKPLPRATAAHMYSSLGGLSEEIATLKEIVNHSLLQPEILTRFGLKRTKGVLLHGAPGTGKTTLAQAVASEAGVKMFVINGPEIVTEYYGESEATLRDVFDSAAHYAPSVVFIDELDAITPERKEGSEELGQRMMATLLTLMDGVHKDGVLVIAATNRPESIDPALRRHGRFDYEIEIGVPTPKGREEILHVHLSKMKHALTHKDVEALASSTHGFVGADLFALCNEAAMAALRHHVHSRKDIVEAPLLVQWKDFELAKVKIRPSAMREVLLEVPKVRWSDIGGQAVVKQQLKEIVEWPHKHQDSFLRIGTTPPKGVLLYGPPGCSKTLMARAVAAEAGLNFIAVKGPEVFSKWVGESEKAVRALFARAKAAAPSIVFFDEIDGLAITRNSGHGAADGVSVEDRVMSQLLVELDGVTPRNGVSVIAATNRPDKLDPALLRPGRFDRLIYVAPPEESARQQIFEIHLRDTPCAKDVSTADLACRTEGYTGADIAAVCREAALVALEETLSAEAVRLSHFDVALTRVLPSKFDMKFDRFQRAG